MKSRRVLTFIASFFTFIFSSALMANVEGERLEKAVDATYEVTYVNSQGMPAGTGSGWLLDTKAYGLKGCYVVTNAHVVTEGDLKSKKVAVSRVYVSSRTRQQFGTVRQVQHAKITYLDKRADIAILNVENCEGVKPFKLQFESVVGEKLYAIGSPMGHQYTVTTGILSYKTRLIPLYSGQVMIQSDVPINSGNSGGPLLNENLEVVGMNSATMIPRNGSGRDGLAIAVRAITIHQAMLNYQEFGQPSYPSLGFMFSSVNGDVLDYLNYPDALSKKGCNGVYVSKVLDGAAAHASGLLIDDIVIAINGKCINNNENLFSVLNTSNVNTPFKLRVWRASEERVVEMTLQAQEKFEPYESTRLDGNEQSREYSGLLGFEISLRNHGYPTDKPVVAKVYQYSEAFWQNVLLGYTNLPQGNRNRRIQGPRMPMRPPAVIMNVLKNPHAIIGEDGKKTKSYQEILSVKDTAGRELTVITQSSLEAFARNAKRLNAKLVLEMRFVVIKATTFAATFWREDATMTQKRIIFLDPTAYQAPE